MHFALFFSDPSTFGVDEGDAGELFSIVRQSFRSMEVKQNNSFLMSLKAFLVDILNISFCQSRPVIVNLPQIPQWS